MSVLSRSTDWSPARRVLGGLTALAALGLLLATFLPVLRLSSADPSALPGGPISFSGFDRHSISLVVVALVALPAALFVVRGTRIAAFVVLVCALAALLVAVGVDLPDLRQKRSFGAELIPARASAGPGYYLETLSAILLLFSGGGLLFLQARSNVGQPPPDGDN